LRQAQGTPFFVPSLWGLVTWFPKEVAMKTRLAIWGIN
jgi:hypothetical protein